MSTIRIDRSPKALTLEQIDFYRENGWLLVERALPGDWLDRLRVATHNIVDSARSMTKSASGVNLAEGHTAEQPSPQVISDSHHGESFTHLDANEQFIGELNPAEMPRARAQPTVDLFAPAGSIEFLDYRTLHQDMWDGTERGGALLYAAYATRDARPRGEPRYPDVPSRRRGVILPQAV